MNARDPFAELKRRNVYKVAIAHAVVAWLLMQIGTQAFAFFRFPIEEFGWLAFKWSRSQFSVANRCAV
jgi:hypothetical protein